MNLLVIAIVGIAAIGFVLWGAFKLGLKAPVASLPLAFVLIVAAGKLLPMADIHPGEGAAAGVAIVPVMIWLLTALCMLAALAMLLASARADASAMAWAVLALAVVACGYVLYVQWRPAAAPNPQPPHAQAAPRATRTEGAAWAMDNNVTSAAQCQDGSAEFIAGCQGAVARMSANSPPDRP